MAKGTHGWHTPGQTLTVAYDKAAVSLLESGEYCYIKAINNNNNNTHTHTHTHTGTVTEEDERGGRKAEREREHRE